MPVSSDGYGYGIMDEILYHNPNGLRNRDQWTIIPLGISDTSYKT